MINVEALVEHRQANIIGHAEQVQAEQSAVAEIEARSSMGVVLMIVAIDPRTSQPLIWTVMEQGEKGATNKKKGQVTIPSETRKRDESPAENLFGALGEFTSDDDDLGSISLIPGQSFVTMPLSILAYGGKPADLAILLYEGPLGLQHRPVDSDETVPNGWMPPDEIRAQNGTVREVAHASLKFAIEQGVLRDFVARVSDPSSRIPLSSLVRPEFSIREFVEQREAKPDIPLA